MFEALSENITNRLVNKTIIKSEEQELYRYGVQQGLTILLNLATTLVIGVVCGMVWQSIVFLIAYIPLRSFAGGYHCKTPTRCYICSIVLITATLLVMRFAGFTNLICGIMLLVSGIVIVLLAPVQDKNKPLDELEHKVYRRNALFIWVFELALTVACIVMDWRSPAVCLTITLTVMAMMLMLGKLKNVFAK